MARMNGEKQRRLSNGLCRCPALTEAKRNSPLLRDFLPKGTVWKRERKKSNFRVEKPDNHYRDQVTKVDIKSGKS